MATFNQMLDWCPYFAYHPFAVMSRVQFPQSDLRQIESRVRKWSKYTSVVPFSVPTFTTGQLKSPENTRKYSRRQYEELLVRKDELKSGLLKIIESPPMRSYLRRCKLLFWLSASASFTSWTSALHFDDRSPFIGSHSEPLFLRCNRTHACSAWKRLYRTFFTAMLRAVKESCIPDALSRLTVSCPTFSPWGHQKLCMNKGVSSLRNCIQLHQRILRTKNSLMWSQDSPHTISTCYVPYFHTEKCRTSCTTRVIWCYINLKFFLLLYVVMSWLACMTFFGPAINGNIANTVREPCQCLQPSQHQEPLMPERKSTTFITQSIGHVRLWRNSSSRQSPTVTLTVESMTIVYWSLKHLELDWSCSYTNPLWHASSFLCACPL